MDFPFRAGPATSAAGVDLPLGRHTGVLEMETFAQPKNLVHDPRFMRDREQITATLSLDVIDTPIRDVISAFNALPHCYTLQSCYGHFLHAAQRDPHSLLNLPANDIGTVEYRIAYIALCIEKSEAGRRLIAWLRQVTEIDPAYVQFGSPDWFWSQHLNSYAIQVEPERFKDKDVAILEYEEALYVQEVRGLFFERLREVPKALNCGAEGRILGEHCK